MWVVHIGWELVLVHQWTTLTVLFVIKTLPMRLDAKNGEQLLMEIELLLSMVVPTLSHSMAIKITHYHQQPGLLNEH